VLACPHPVFCLLLCLLWLWPWAALAEPEPIGVDVAAGDADEAIEEIRIVYPPPAAHSTPLPREVFDSGRARNLSEALGEIPGLDGVRRGASGLEPVIRGLGWERVPVQIQGLPVMGAGPGRMDTPATLFGPAALQKVEVVKSLPSVTLGPGGTGGHVVVYTDYERPANAGSELHGRLRGSYGSNGNNFNGEAVVQGGTDRLDVHAGVDGRRNGDYESGSGLEIPDSASGVGGVLSMGYRPAEGQRIWGSYLDSSYWDEDFPSLPMDAHRGWARIGNAGWRLQREEGTFAGARLRFGYSGAKHWMDNSSKATAATMQASTRGESDSAYTAFASDWRVGDSFGSTAGIDFGHLQRDSMRARRMMMSTAYDHLWPDVYQWDLGFFAEGRLDLPRSLRLRWGARLDQVESDARAADDPSLMMLSVRQSYALFYGADALDTRRSQTLGSGNLLLEWKPGHRLETHLGAGVTSRAPAVSERYFAFAPAPGGFQVGNPTLAPEYKSEIEIGGAWHGHWIDASLQAYHAWVTDYILPTVVDLRDVDGDLNPDLVRGFRNVDARLYGAEANLTFHLTRWLSLPSTFAYVRGRNTGEGRDLPEIPPFEARLALRVEAGGRWPWWAQIGGRFATSQDRIDPLFGENETPGYEVFHLRCGIEPIRNLQLELGIENLFDQEYHEHLTREVPVPVGSLAAGSEVPEPGRSVYVTARWKF